MSGRMEATGQVLETNHESEARETLYDPSHVPIEDLTVINELTLLVQQHRKSFSLFEELLSLLRHHRLTAQLHQTREFMSTHLALSEHMWIEWFEDAQKVAVSDETLDDLYNTSLSDYPHSAMLWTAYTNKMLDKLQNRNDQERSQISGAHDTPLERNSTSINQNKYDLYYKAWQAMRYDFQKSREFWILLQQVSQSMAQSGQMPITSYFEVILRQLEIPHAGLDETFADYSKAVTSFDNDNYERHLLIGNQTYQATRNIMLSRGDQEARLLASGNSSEAFAHYVKSQLSRKGQSQQVTSNNLHLLMRAAFQHRQLPDFWLTLYGFVAKIPSSQSLMKDIMSLAVRHCVSSGELYACHIRAIAQFQNDPDQVLQACELALSNFEPLEKPLDIVNIVRTTYLCLKVGSMVRRSEELPELSFIVIMADQYSQIEDPFFTLLQLLVECQTVSGNEVAARKSWKTAVKRHEHQALFWLAYLQWEVNQNEYGLARNLIKTACLRTTDAPQIVFNAAQIFEILHGDVVEFDKTNAVVLKATENFLTSHAVDKANPGNESESAQETRRLSSKRDLAYDETDIQEEHQKRQRIEETNKESSATERRRETTTVFVKNLPLEVASDDIRKFFRECGSIRCIQLFDIDEDRRLAIVEFGNLSDAMAAETRTLKELSGRSVIVEPTTGSVLFVTNWPPTFQETDLKEFFSKFGMVLEIRMPSLRFDQGRRFAYVQMSTKSEAQAALQSNGTILSNEYTLEVALSDSQAKRGNAAEEHRELFVKKLSWNSTKSDVEKLFSNHGTIRSLRLPSTFSKVHHDGIAFIEFENAASAQHALIENGSILKGRSIEVTMSQPRNRSRASGIVNNKSKHLDLRTPKTQMTPDPATIQAKTLGIMNLADTISDAQLRSVFEPYGNLRKVQLVPEHGGAIIEFVEAAAAGKASLALSGITIGHSIISIGRYEDLMQQTSSLRSDSAAASQKLALAPRKGRVVHTVRRRIDHKNSNVSSEQDKRTPASTELMETSSGQKSKVQAKNQEFFRDLINKDVENDEAAIEEK